MERQRLGSTDLSVSPLSLGTYTLTKVWDGDLSDGETALRTAVDEGINFFDTARAYGGAESVLGRTLADVIKRRRDEIVLCSKGGFELRDRPGAATPFVPNSSPAYLRECVEQSLRKLGTDYLDVFLIHWHDPDVPVERVAETMDGIVAAGLARYVGVSNYTVEQMRAFASVRRIDVAQVPYSLFCRQMEGSVIPALNDMGAGIMGYAALAQGFLTGAFREGQTFPPGDFRSHTADFQGDRFRARVRVAEKLKQVAERCACSLAELAIAWVLAQPGGVIPLAGAQVPEHVRSTVRALDVKLDAATVGEITALAATAPEMDFASLVQ